MEQNWNQYYKKITSEHNLFDLKLAEVWRYRDLITMFTKRNFTLRYKQTVLGPAWLFINPIASSLIYCFVFGGIAGISTGEIPQMLFYLSGNAMWGFFSGCLNKNSSTFTANAGVFGKVYFPRLTTPLAHVLTSILEFFIQMIMVLVFMAYYAFKGLVHPNLLHWPLILLVLMVLGIMGMGVGIIISSFTTKYRDLQILVGFAVSLWMYVTPVIYPMSQATNPTLQKILLINPVTSLIELYRYALLGEGTISVPGLAWAAVFSAGAFVLGVAVFNRVERTFMDTV